MPFDFTCIHCGGRMEVSTKYGEIICTSCGRLIDGSLPNENKTKGPHDNAATWSETGEQWHMGSVYYKGERTRWLQILINTLRAQLYRGDREGALETCTDLIGMERNMTDAYYWRAKLSDDPELKRENLSMLLALEPNHMEGRQMMMVLNGDLTEEEIERAADIYRDNRQHVEGPVPAITESLLCPICGGTLTVNADHSVICGFCGYEDDTQSHATQGSAATSVAVAVIKQRAKPVQWEVGERIVHCNNCGAERVLPEGQLSTVCPFCGSQNVVTQDALEAFRQPDGIVKFRIGRKEAENAVKGALDSTMERLRGIFINNDVDRIRYEGIFLPYWIFDIYGSVLLTERARRDEDSLYQQSTIGVRSENPNSLRNVNVPGVTSPPSRLLNRLGQFDMSGTIPYQPQLLASFAAELYTVDFPSASLEARSVFRKAMEQRYPSSQQVERTIANKITHMDMKLLLLPVWVVTILEKDDDIRLALVHGQSGKVVLGKASQRDR